MCHSHYRQPKLKSSSINQPAVQIDILQKGSDKTDSTTVLLRISHRLKVTV